MISIACNCKYLLLFAGKCDQTFLKEHKKQKFQW